MSDPVRLTRQGRKAQTCAAIVDAARFLFANVGYFDVSLPAVGRRAGCSEASIRAHYVDKAGLWRAAMDCAAPDPRLAEEVALAGVTCPGQAVWLYADGGRCRASIGNPVRALTVHAAGSFSGSGSTPAEAVRQARISAERFVGERAAA